MVAGQLPKTIRVKGVSFDVTGGGDGKIYVSRNNQPTEGYLEKMLMIVTGSVSSPDSYSRGWIPPSTILHTGTPLTITRSP